MKRLSHNNFKAIHVFFYSYVHRIILCSFIIFISCNNPGQSNPEQDMLPSESVPAYTAKDMYTWSVDTDSMIKTRNPVSRPEFLQTDSLIKGLNAAFPEIQLRKLKQGHDTLYVKIDDADYLTQQMGSTGPNIYFANVFFNLASVPGIRYINIDFKAGDHAEPDVLSAELYKEYKEQ